MTDGYFFDTDCLSAFLWVRGESMEVGSAEYHDYLQMTTALKTGMQIIGSGEAATEGLSGAAIIRDVDLQGELA